jgi:tetratricopeptide (TPR) repeat protein
MNKYLNNLSTDSTSIYKILFCIIIIAVTLFVYSNIKSYDFINFDDNHYVTENHHVQKGVKIENIKWAFSFSNEAIKFYWHPITWFSHMIDCHLFGLNPGLHHFSSVILHCINAVLIFFIFYQLTGELWQSVFVAALFAVHPLNVESVAWISERKNVLSTFFWLLTMLAYIYYAKYPGYLRYLLVVFPFIIGLLTKPMLVTLPCALLLIDFWPLRRLNILHPDNTKNHFTPTSIKKLLLEKLPLLFLSLLSICISVLSIHITRQIIPEKAVPLTLRLQNAIVSYVKYIGKILWPHDLAAFYPFPDFIPIWQPIIATLILLVISIGALILVKKAPYLLIGWLWFLGTLFPVIGISQHALWPELADRWVYIPQIGIFIILAWGGSAIFSKLRYRIIILLSIATMLIAIFAVLSRKQLSYWQDSKTLFQHAVYVTENNPIAYFNLGAALASDGQIDQAINHYYRSLSLKENAEVHSNLGNALAQKGQFKKAIKHINIALNKNPLNHRALNNLGNIQLDLGNPDAAINLFIRALKVAPDFKELHNNLGNALMQKSMFNEAVSQYYEILKIEPNHVEANINLGVALTRLNEVESAIFHYQKALHKSPDIAEAHNNLGVLFFKKNELNKAKVHFETALRLNPDYISARDNLLRLQAVIGKK